MPKSISSQKNLGKHFHLQGDATHLQPIAIHSSFVQNEPQKQKLTSPPPTLVLPFPPQINPEELMNSKTRKLPSKPPNAFFIYRKVYTKELVAQNLRFKMTDVSPWVSISWKRESPEVKDKYKAIAKEVRQLYKQLKLKSTQVDNNTNSDTSYDSNSSSDSPSPPSDSQLLSPSLFWILPTDSDYSDYSDYSDLVPLPDSFGFSTPDTFPLWHDDNIFQELSSDIYENGNTEFSYESYELIDFDYSQYLHEQLDVGQNLIQGEGLDDINSF
ncbi:3758_t:CDS:1 [Cetraspora pellucida]|uniref:3758_t:CDS:1 n=1 Tax=Cetraspora pellucida TaxID=1433469 RepID=A0A9N9C5G8_9GLOM|nr:3758_t:CDS:1 [Cetraspora pellucida]